MTSGFYDAMPACFAAKRATPEGKLLRTTTYYSQSEDQPAGGKQQCINKPHIRRVYGYWGCQGAGHYAMGHTPGEAYRKWVDGFRNDPLAAFRVRAAFGF